MGFDFTQFLANAERAAQRQVDAAAEGLGEFAEQVMADSQEQCPVSPTDPKHPLYLGTSGSLRDSGVVKDVETGGGQIAVEIGYGANYAAAVHERLGANHQYPGAVNPKAKHKFLEDPIRDNAGRLGPYIADKMREVTNG